MRRPCDSPSCDVTYEADEKFLSYHRHRYCSSACFKADLKPSAPTVEWERNEIALRVEIPNFEGIRDIVAQHTERICSECGHQAEFDRGVIVGTERWYCARHPRAKVYIRINGRYAGEEPR